MRDLNKMKPMQICKYRKVHQQLPVLCSSKALQMQHPWQLPDLWQTLQR